MPSQFVLHHPLVRLARIAVETYVREHRVLPVPYPLPPDQQAAAGVFVSLVASSTQLRGSIGTLRPTQPTLAAEVILNAVAAAVRDPRFTPVHPPELVDLAYTLDIVRELGPLTHFEAHDPACSGLVVRAGRRWGAMLPAVEGIGTALQQRDAALRKALIAADEAFEMLRFSVERLS